MNNINRCRVNYNVFVPSEECGGGARNPFKDGIAYTCSRDIHQVMKVMGAGQRDSNIVIRGGARSETRETERPSGAKTVLKRLAAALAANATVK